MGILSACLPALRPLLTSSFAASIRSRFTRSQGSASGRNTAGLMRIPDVERGGAPDTSNSHLVNAAGHTERHLDWYNNEVYAMGSKTDDRASEGSKEEVIPMGKIGVRREVTVDAEDREKKASLSVASPRTFRDAIE